MVRKETSHNYNSVEELARIVIDNLILNVDNGRVDFFPIKDILDHYDTKGLVLDRRALIIFQGIVKDQLEYYYPSDYNLDTTILSWRILKKSREQLLKPFYDNWYFRNEYKDKDKDYVFDSEHDIFPSH